MDDQGQADLSIPTHWIQQRHVNWTPFPEEASLTIDFFSLFQSLETDAQNPFRQIHHGNATRIRSMSLLMNWNHRSWSTNIYFNYTKQRKKVIIPNINRLCQSCISGHTALPCRMFEVWLLEVLPRTGSLKYFSLFLDKHELIFIQKSNLRSWFTHHMWIYYDILIFLRIPS